MGTIVEFQLLVLDSLRCSSKAESPINRSVDTIYIFIYLFYFDFDYIYVHMYVNIDVYI